MNTPEALEVFRVAMKELEEQGSVKGPTLTNLVRLVRFLLGPDLKMDYVQRKVTIHALEMLRADCEASTSLRNDAQYIVNECPIRRKKDEEGHQSVEIIIGEVLHMLK